MSRVGVFGAGWVGVVTAAGLAELGHEVVVRDIDEARISALNAGELPFYEEGLKELLEKNRARLRFTTHPLDLKDCDFFFVCVGTPSDYAGDADLSAVWSAIEDLPPLEQPATLVMKSTVPVGTGKKVRQWLATRGIELTYVSNPEFLAEGTAVRDFLQPDRVVVGAFDMRAGDRVASLYQGFEAPIVRCDVASSEMIKLAANAALVTRVSFINEIANVCEAVGADVVKVAEGIGLDHRIGPHFLRAGIGWGGSCFGKDSYALKQLASNTGYHFQLLNAVIEVNELQKRRVVGKLQHHLGDLRGKTVALLGFAFKPGTDDTRESPALVLAARLMAEGAKVRAWDPKASAEVLPRAVEACDSILEAVMGADAAVIVTEWPEITALTGVEYRDAMRNPLIIDGRNLLEPTAARAAGFAYEGIGRPQLSDEDEHDAARERLIERSTSGTGFDSEALDEARRGWNGNEPELEQAPES